jgi:AcrR family transcriptional regulator
MRKRAEDRRLEIVEAVMRLAVEMGPDRLTTQAVADAVGISQPAVFRHFPTRAALWLAVAHHVSGRVRACWDAVASPTDDPIADVRRLAVAQMGVVADEPSILAIVFSHELRVADPALAAVFRGLMGDISGRLAARFAAAGDRLLASPADAALLVLGLLQGLALRWSLAGRGFDLVSEGERLLDLQLAGLVRPGSGVTP